MPDSTAQLDQMNATLRGMGEGLGRMHEEMLARKVPRHIAGKAVLAVAEGLGGMVASATTSKAPGRG